MKNVFYLIFIFLAFQYNIFAQSFKPLTTDTTHFRYIHDMDEIKNSKLVQIQANYASTSNIISVTYSHNALGNQLTEVDSFFSEIVIYDYNLQKINALKVESKEDSINFIYRLFDDTIRNELVFHGMHSVDENNIFRLFIHTDYTLNITKTVLTQAAEDNLYNISPYFIVNNEGNYIYYYNGSLSAGIIEVDAYSNTINSNSINGSDGIFQLSNNKYLYVYGGDHIKILDSQLNLESEYYFSSLGFNTSGLPNSIYDCKDLLVLPHENSFFVSGMINRNVGTAISGFNEIILKIDLDNFNDEIFYEDTIIDMDSNFFSFYNGIKSIHPNYTFNLFKMKECGFYYNEENCTEEFLRVTCLNEDGDLRWQKMLGGDALYNPQGLIATSDSGVIIFTNRKDIPNGDSNFGSDIYYTKLDKNGLLDTVVTSNLQFISLPSFDVFVYPNPISNFLYFEHTLFNANLSIEIFDLNGRQLVSKRIINNLLDTGKLTKGNYTYILKNNMQFLQNGKFVKL